MLPAALRVFICLDGRSSRLYLCARPKRRRSGGQRRRPEGQKERPPIAGVLRLLRRSLRLSACLRRHFRASRQNECALAAPRGAVRQVSASGKCRLHPGVLPLRALITLASPAVPNSILRPPAADVSRRWRQDSTLSGIKGALTGGEICSYADLAPG